MYKNVRWLASELEGGFARLGESRLLVVKDNAGNSPDGVVSDSDSSELGLQSQRDFHPDS